MSTPTYLVIDTETSDLFQFKDALGKPIPADDPSQPRMCGFTGIIVGDDMTVLDEFSRLICPNGTTDPDTGEWMPDPDTGWVITPEITAINGLTTERCVAEGVHVVEVLDWYSSAIKDGLIVVAYNAQFDCKMMRGELRRAGMADLFEETRNTCLMRAASKHKVPKAGGGKGFPKLADAVLHFTGKPHENAHTSRADAFAALEVLKGLHAADALIPPEVHYAKNYGAEA